MLSACAGQSPPFVSMTNGVGTQGFSVELLGKVAVGLGRTARIQELPWARCLRDVEAGRIDVAVDAYDDVARRTKFVYSMPYYSLTPQVFYIPGATEGGAPVSSAQALQKLRGCGVHEYTYEHYGLRTPQMDRNAKTNHQALRKLLAGRCDYAVEELEYIIGGRQTVADWPDESTIRSYRPAWAQAPQLHFLIGKKRPDAGTLAARLDAEIVALESSGWLKQLRQQYFGTPQKPR